eukprot:4691537-Pleurochrysis_carterae.AAC.6
MHAMSKWPGIPALGRVYSVARRRTTSGCDCRLRRQACAIRQSRVLRHGDFSILRSAQPSQAARRGRCRRWVAASADARGAPSSAQRALSRAHGGGGRAARQDEAGATSANTRAPSAHARLGPAAAAARRQRFSTLRAVLDPWFARVPPSSWQMSVHALCAASVHAPSALLVSEKRVLKERSRKNGHFVIGEHFVVGEHLSLKMDERACKEQVK